MSKVKRQKKCQYGSKCYRKNPQHLKDFSHSSDEEVRDVSQSTNIPHYRSATNWTSAQNAQGALQGKAGFANNVS